MQNWMYITFSGDPVMTWQPCQGLSGSEMGWRREQERHKVRWERRSGERTRRTRRKRRQGEVDRGVTLPRWKNLGGRKRDRER